RAPSRSSSATSPSAPARPTATTPIGDATAGASPQRSPVMTSTTPAGTSAVARHSASSIATSGCASDAITTAVLPPTMTGASRDTRPSSGGSGARMPVTPVGSGTVKLKYGPETGFDEPTTWANLSAHSAYQTTRSIA